MDKVQYREENSASAEYKEAYRDAIERLIAAREADACHTRNAFAKDIFTQPEKYRASLRAMLGWPLTETGEHTLPAVKMVKLAEEAHHFIYRVSVEILGDLEMTGLLFRSKSGRQPLVIVQHQGVFE